MCSEVCPEKNCWHACRCGSIQLCMFRAPIWGWLLTCAACGALAQRSAERADLIMIHGRILTVDAHDSLAQAIAIRAGRIVLVGSDTQALGTQRPGTVV